MLKSATIGPLFAAMLCTVPAFAQDGNGDMMSSTIYAGVGSSFNEGDRESDATPLTLGFTHQPVGGQVVWGFDIAREGTKYDSTSWQNASVRSALSFNLIVGRNFADSGSMKFDAGLLLGIREAAEDCPGSYLGFRCYANGAPSTDYKFNGGVLATVSFDRFVVGLRATSESGQVVAGMRF
ncbi:MAG: hypothetical protein ACK4NW_09960 [Roseinatronobacter sp.]